MKKGKDNLSEKDQRQILSNSEADKKSKELTRSVYRKMGYSEEKISELVAE